MTNVLQAASEASVGVRRPLFECSEVELAAWCVERGEPRYRAAQIRRWIARRRAMTLSEMTDLPTRVRCQLDEEWSILGTRPVTESIGSDRTRKLLLGLADGQRVECVLMAERRRRTICLSTQVGCAMGCVFCASGLDGVVRNLTTGEMIEQMLWLQHGLAAGERISHLVVMGMGEPLANLHPLLAALDFATGPEGLGISGRHVTISTVGLAARIGELAAAGRPYRLAVSLHAPTDELRAKIVPLARTVKLRDLMLACDRYRETTKRQVTFEYVLLAGVNDQPVHARQLAGLLQRRDVLVNLIPYNEVAALPFAAPAPAITNRFALILRQCGLVVKIRKRKGANIEAACGQLRSSQGPGTRFSSIQPLFSPGSNDPPDARAINRLPNADGRFRQADR